MFLRLLKGAWKETCSVFPHLWTSISQRASRTHVTTVALRYEKRDLLIQRPDYIIESHLLQEGNVNLKEYRRMSDLFY